MATSGATALVQVLDAVLTVQSFLISINEDWLELCRGGKEVFFFRF